MSQRSQNIIIFACNWDGLSCIEAAARDGLTYSSSVRIVRVGCLSRMHAGLILKGFELGAAGILLVGCSPGNCHLDTESGGPEREYEKARALLELLGLGSHRLALARPLRGDGEALVRNVADLERAVRTGKDAVPRG